MEGGFHVIKITLAVGRRMAFRGAECELRGPWVVKGEMAGVAQSGVALGTWREFLDALEADLLGWMQWALPRAGSGMPVLLAAAAGERTEIGKSLG